MCGGTAPKSEERSRSEVWEGRMFLTGLFSQSINDKGPHLLSSRIITESSRDHTPLGHFQPVHMGAGIHQELLYIDVEFVNKSIAPEIREIIRHLSEKGSN